MISLRNDLPIWAMPNGIFVRAVALAEARLTRGYGRAIRTV